MRQRVSDRTGKRDGVITGTPKPFKPNPHSKNAPAVRVYERVGFTAVHTWKCFLGEPKANDAGEQLQPRELHEVDLGMIVGIVGTIAWRH